jgi:NADH-quinone oxidoreductase subunit C
MDPLPLERALRDALPDVPFERMPSVDPHLSIRMSSEAVPHAMPILHGHHALLFSLLADLTAVDFWPKQPRFEVVYILVSIELRHRLRVRVPLPPEDAHIATVTGLWPAANWLEREVWDLFGIAFDGHPDARRLLMPEDWEGHPLRKDAPVQIQLKPNASEPIQVTAEEFRSNVARDRLARSR